MHTSTIDIAEMLRVRQLKLEIIQAYASTAEGRQRLQTALDRSGLPAGHPLRAQVEHEIVRATRTPTQPGPTGHD